ncbi:MAG: MBL fold metallo-hydrolase [Leptospiraceae bacterium]|nr:MBL fold metallo-hydrolase [Leptospiraceae bacterium]MCZ8345865.1 MBL fold metallo-hydrolase [Leptospiraceae bacterium]
MRDQWKFYITILSIFLFILSCGATNPYFNPEKMHHTTSGFKNPSKDFESHGLGGLIRWTSSRWMNEEDNNPEHFDYKKTENDGSQIRNFKGLWSVTWIGHASSLIQWEGLNILTDPIWSERCSPVSWAGPKRYTQPGIDMDNLPKIDLVVISHNHYDHMDLDTLLELEKRFSPTFIAGLGSKKFLQDAGLTHVLEMDWWDEVLVQGKRVIFTPTQHFSARGIFDRDETLWGSYAFIGSKSKIYFAGDTGYFKGFKEIGEKFGGFDLAILPIGAYNPRWFMEPVHVDPSQSVQAFMDLKANYMMPMHYKTFVLSDEALDQPLKSTMDNFQRKGIDKKRLLALNIGESFFRN